MQIVLMGGMFTDDTLGHNILAVKKEIHWEHFLEVKVTSFQCELI